MSKFKRLQKEIANRRYDDETWGSQAAAYRLVFGEGWKECSDQYERIIEDLESLQYNNPNVRQDAYNKGVLDCINRFRRAFDLESPDKNSP